VSEFGRLFNAPLYLLLLNILDFQIIKIYLLILFGIYGFIVFVRRINNMLSHSSEFPSSQKWIETPAGFRGDWLFGLFLLSLPVLNPWYVAWILPFATLYARWWSWTASYVVLLSYWYGGNVNGVAGASEQLGSHTIIIEYSLLLLIPIMMRWVPPFSKLTKAVELQRH